MLTYHPTLYPFESKWIDIQGHMIHYIDEGQGETILFSHPPLASSFMYRRFISILKKQFRCIAIDYPAFGLSRAHKEYQPSIEAQSKVLNAFVEQLQLSNIYLLGHDTGGPSAFKVAIDHPSLFRGLILTDTIIYPVSEYPRIDRMLSIVGSPLFSWINAHTNFLVYMTYRFGIRTRRLSSAEKQAYSHLFDTPSKRKKITQMLYNLKESEAFMKNIKHGFNTTLHQHPTLLIYGEQDPVHQMGIAERIHFSMADSELHLITGEGHFPHEGKPEAMCELMAQWIHKVSFSLHKSPS